MAKKLKKYTFFSFFKNTFGGVKFSFWSIFGRIWLSWRPISEPFKNFVIFRKIIGFTWEGRKEYFDLLMQFGLFRRFEFEASSDPRRWLHRFWLLLASARGWKSLWGNCSQPLTWALFSVPGHLSIVGSPARF